MPADGAAPAMESERSNRDTDSGVPDSAWTMSAASGPEPASETSFTPGTMLADRYRVVAPLGRGGMGDVYRADDTKLGQPVALKFVRGTLSADLRERLYAEVRIGRQVSHPNVCRLYDIVEMGGHTFLAMEYVDGEDLASLLERIGRLPADKALEIARDLCAGLTAMHDKGIVHRDLKPGNVMIDGRGRARLADFGLAVALAEPGRFAFAGTPAYMSPEQLSGGGLTPRADLYGFGLIVYEMLSGRRFYEARTLEELGVQHRESKNTRLASVARDADPRLERVIQQCLEENPESRPSSARSVLAMLPGGDPLEAAVAAGETPSPEAVAAAARVGDLSPAAAWSALAGVILLLACAAWFWDRGHIYTRRMLPRPADVLSERARAVLDRLGHSSAVDDAQAFEWDRARVLHISRSDRSPDRWVRLAQSPLPPVSFFYRRSPRNLVALHRDGMVRRDDPPLDVPGMSTVVLDTRGRLLTFVAVPPRVEAPQAWPDPEWGPLFQEAGLDPAAFRGAPSEWTAPVDSDRKAAWQGVYPGEPPIPVRIEAASYHGRPVWFAVLPPWATEAAMLPPPITPTPVGQHSLIVLAMAMPVGGVLLARRNLRLGRGDRKGAFRLALFVFVVYTAASLLRADHVASFGPELWVLIKAFAYPAFWAAQVWLLYMALEPYARRRLPQVLISWKRLLGGSVRDPLVGRDLLLGALAGGAAMIILVVEVAVPAWYGRPTMSPAVLLDGAVLSSFRQATFRVLVNLFSAVLYGMVFLFILTLLRMLLKRTWAAALLWCALMAAPMYGQEPASEWVSGAVRAVLLLAVLLRGGLLALVVTLYVMFSAVEVPLTTDVTAWYALHAVPVVAAILGVAVYGFHTSLGGKPAFGASLLDD
jgi:predicted Ser/Thr protein kinase